MNTPESTEYEIKIWNNETSDTCRLALKETVSVTDVWRFKENTNICEQHNSVKILRIKVIK